MKKKKYALRIVKLLSLFLVLAVCVCFLQEYVLCHADANRERIKGFYLEDKDSLDVVVIGASEVYAGYSAGYAYQKYGITSYPLATQSNTIKSLKTQIKETIATQHPKLIVVELNCATYPDDEQTDKDANFRNYVDNIPLNGNKAELINNVATSDQLEYYVPIVKYHSMWKDFPDGMGWAYTIIQDRLRGYTLLKGAKGRTEVYKANEKIYNDELSKIDKRQKISSSVETYLRDVLEYCQKENIDNIVFSRFPHVVTKKMLNRYYRGNTVGDIINEYGFDFINFERNVNQTNLDVNTDFYNIDHLNIDGQRKFTEYFFETLIEKYGLEPSDLTDSQKKEWEEASKYYDAYYEYAESIEGKGLNRNINEFFRNIDEIEKFL